MRKTPPLSPLKKLKETDFSDCANPVVRTLPANRFRGNQSGKSRHIQETTANENIYNYTTRGEGTRSSPSASSLNFPTLPNLKTRLHAFLTLGRKTGRPSFGSDNVGIFLSSKGLLCGVGETVRWVFFSLPEGTRLVVSSVGGLELSL